MTGGREPFLKWPGWNHLKFAALLTVLGTIWFIIVYAGCDTITAHRATRVRIHFDWELRIPLIPPMTIFYMSIYALFLAAPFIIRERKDFGRLCLKLNVAILIAGIFFLLIPAQLAFPPAENLGLWTSLFNFADRLNLHYNLAPSLHVALSVSCIATFSKRASPSVGTVLWLWAIAISLSTVLTHQHHVIDVLAGWALAWALCTRI
ncbi:MAG TPA: phosphatase PAP2 family protein [Verrucomicrobiae bacterium]|nr:phosphatase PAP2 family protein [Verrucomicrobiae bacterium]